MNLLLSQSLHKEVKRYCWKFATYHLMRFACIVTFKLKNIELPHCRWEVDMVLQWDNFSYNYEVNTNISDKLKYSSRVYVSIFYCGCSAVCYHLFSEGILLLFPQTLFHSKKEPFLRSPTWRNSSVLFFQFEDCTVRHINPILKKNQIRIK